MIEKSLFSVPFWELLVTQVEPYIDEMTSEVDELIEKQLSKNKEDRYLAHQTKSDPFRLPSVGWKLLDAEMKKAFSKIIRKKLPRHVNGELHIRRWAIRYGTLSVEESSILKEESVHSHCPALLTSVFYLSIPEAIEQHETAKTRFFNCLPTISKLLTPKEHDIGGEAGRMIIFPGDIEHTSLCEDWFSKSDEKRIVVVSDVYFVSGFQDRERDERVTNVQI